MRIEMFNLKRQMEQIRAPLDQCITNVLNHGQFILGPEVQQLENKLAKYVGVKHCIAVSSGLDALILSLLALGIQQGDEVITTPFTFFATIEAIYHVGAVPVFVDIDDKTFNIDAKKIKHAITHKTKAILTVSLFGQCPDFDELKKVIVGSDIILIEDAAQSFGARYKGQCSGSIAEVSCTSFFPSKPLGCFGDGGACFTNSNGIAEQITALRAHGQSKRYKHDQIGFTGRLDTIQAAVLLEKLKIFDTELRLREKVAQSYNQKLINNVTTPFIADYGKSVYGQYTIRISNRDYLIDALKQANIATAIHYPVLASDQTALKGLEYKKFSLENAKKATQEVLSLPFHPYLKEEEITYICNKINEVYV